MAELHVASPKAVSKAIGIYEWINDFSKSFAIIAGGSAASLADWLFGAVTMTVLLSNYSGFQGSWVKWVMGGVFSMALWGIQVILWQAVLTGKIAKISQSKGYTVTLYAAVFILIIVMKFGDDVSDIFGVYWLIKDNPVQIVFTGKLYSVLLYTILFLTWCICGFAEIFMALSINLLKSGDNSGRPQFQFGGGGGGGHKNKNQGYKGQPYSKPSFISGDARKGMGREELLKMYGVSSQKQQKPAPQGSTRPLYQEPTYRPVSMLPDDDEEE